MVLLPLKLDVGPDVLGLTARRLATFSQATIDVEFQRSVVGEANLEVLVAMFQCQGLRQSGLQGRNREVEDGGNCR